MRLIIIVLVLCPLLCASAHADTEIDRLREALRSATLQARALEDQRTALQAKAAKLDADNTALKADLAEAKAQVRQVKKDYRQAVTEFNERLEERNKSLQQWKDAYAEAATVARAKDAERAKFEAEANDFKAKTKSYAQKNQELVKAGRELLGEYEQVTLGDVLLARDPVTGIKRVRIKSLLEDYDDKIESQSAQEAQPHQ